MTSGPRPAIFLDRDGTLAHEVGYVNHPSRFRLFPFAIDAVRLINRSDYLAVVVTNQTIRQIFFMAVMGAGFGAQGLVARHVGEGRADAADHVTGQALLLGLCVAAFAAALGLGFARPLLVALNVSP